MTFPMQDDQGIRYSEPEFEEQPGYVMGLSPATQFVIVFALTFVLGLIVAAVLLLRLQPYQAQTDQAPAAPVDYEIPTAREAYVPAVEAIRAIDPQAVLMEGVGVWTPVITTTQLNAGRTGWTFYFYLPDTGEMAQVIVDRGKVARVAGRQPWDTPPDLISDQGWRIDSPEAVRFLQENCQAAFDAAGTDAHVLAQLSAAAGNRTLMWNVRVDSAADTEIACPVTVDAIIGVLR